MTRPTMEELRARIGVQGKTGRRGAYGGAPGTGPAGRTCKSCAFLTYTGRQRPKSHPKCGKTAFTSGDATTIYTSSPACHLYKEDA